MIAHRQFTSAAEMLASAAAVHSRCFNSKPRKDLALSAADSKSRKVIPFMALKLPEWQARPTHFDAHVSGSVRFLEMIKAGEIEFAPPERRTILAIVTDVLQRFPGITIPQVKGATRQREIVKARHAAMYAVRMERPDLSYPAIGRWFGGKDHSSILNAVRKIEAARASA